MRWEQHYADRNTRECRADKRISGICGAANHRHAAHKRRTADGGGIKRGTDTCRRDICSGGCRSRNHCADCRHTEAGRHRSCRDER